MRNIGLLALLGMVPVWAGEMPEKAADYLAALVKRPESAALFDRFRDAWLEERSVEDLEKELLARAEAKEPGAWSTLGRAWLAAGKTEQALEAFDKARKQSPSAWLDLESAKLRMAAKDFAAAEKDALTVPEGDPQRLDALKVAGLACLRAERIDEALAHWTKAVAAAPGDIGLLEDLTELTRREGRIELALDYCGKWRDATVDAYGKAMATLRRAELLLGSQRFDEAMTELAAVLEISAEDSWLERESLSRAEQAHRQRGNSTGWATWIGARAEANPARLSFRRTSAQALSAAGKADEALEVLTEVMKRSPGDTAVRWQRIAMLEQSMNLKQAYDECAELAAKEKTEAAGLRLAELAFRLEKKDELKRALDGVLAAAEPGKRVGLAGLYARYGLPESSERIWREEAAGEQGALALRLLAKHLQTAGRDKEALEVWKQLGARDVAQDRMEAAQMLAAAGDRAAAREILLGAREKFSAEPGYEAALADLAMTEEKADEARAIYLKLARTVKRPDELTAAAKGWLRTSATTPDPIKDLGDETADRCLRAAWLASTGKPLPEIREGDELERPVRQALLREMGRWAEVVAMMEARPGDRGPLFLSELAEAKLAAGDLTGALAVTQAWRTRVPDQTSPWLFEAGILEKLGKLPEATQLLRRAAARFEDNEEVARRLFASLQQALDPRESLEFAWKRHDRSQDESVRSGWLRQILEVSKQREQLDELQARFEERARRDPASPGPLMALAELAKARGDSRAELDFLRRAATNAPRDAAVVSALATLEERSGETARALERHVTLARLAPGPDSARSLAQAKIRLGDIEGGMRDLQALAGEKGIDLRALEQSAGDLASRGYVEEAIRLLSAVEPSQRTARLEYVRGTLLDADGREMEAVDAFLRVLKEPDDPAEAQQRANYGYGYGLSSSRQQVSQFLQSYSGREESMPGVFSGFQVPRSLVEAKITIRALLSRLAMERGGEIWTKISQAVPELAVATPEQWREAMAFSQASQRSGVQNWWEFIRSHPGNPLGVMLLVESNQQRQGKPEEVEALLKTPLPLLVQMQLRWDRGEWPADNPEFMESIKPTDWQDEQARGLALNLAIQMSYRAFEEGSQHKIGIADCSRVIAVLDKVGFAGAHAGLMELLKARHALLLGNTEDFLKHLAAWEQSRRNPSQLNRQQYSYGYGYIQGGPPLDAFESWRKKVGDPAAEALIEKIASPLLRCQLTSESKPGQRLARVKRELAALPKEVPLETRRGLVRLSWSLLPRKYQNRDGEEVQAINDDLRKQLEAAVADESDPRMAFEAFIQLRQYRRGDGAAAKTDHQKLKELTARLAASPDPSDQLYAAQFSGNYGLRPQRSAPVATRWGGSSSFSSGSNYSSSRSMLPAILAMEDREQALREATKLLESSARACAGRPEYLREIIESLAKSELLEPALARISLPPDAGLGRRVAMLTLMDACGKKDLARSLLDEIAKTRPWETRWAVDLALRSPDDAEMRRLLDSVAERQDFDQILGVLLAPRNREDAVAMLAQLGRLAEWAPQAKGQRDWISKALFMLVKGGSGLQPLSTKNATQLECYRRFLKLALADQKLGEFGFRVMFLARGVEAAGALTDAAREALLSGAYQSIERTFISEQVQNGMELAALEHLVLFAEANGDEAAFPTEFREKLKIADPESAIWLGKLLAAKSVSDLPDVSNDKAKSSGWVALARHEAAVLRAVSLPGRDAWLTGIFRENKFLSLSENLRHVIRASLLDAQKKKALPERLFALLEASAGPRKNWSKKAQPNQADPTLNRLQPAAELILKTAAETSPATLLAVLDHFREARISVNDADSFVSTVVASQSAQNRQQVMAELSELFAKKREAAFTFGAWQSQSYGGGKSVFIWCLPQLLQNLRSDVSSEMVKKVKADPEAGFLELLVASNYTGDQVLRRRTLLKAAPDLAKLPVEIRNSVIDQLTANMADEDNSGLPTFVTARISENAIVQRKQRISEARSNLESLKSSSSGSSYQSQQYGSLLGQVIGDDEALTSEILAAWRPLAEADKSGKEMNAFIEGLLSNSRSSLRNTLAILRFLDSLLKDSMPAPRTPNSGDPLGNLWSRLKPENKVDPALWKQIAALSPKFQTRIWLAAIRYTGENPELSTDPKLVETLRDAAKGGEVTRTALEWLMESARVRRDSKVRIDGDKLLALANALKSAGATPTDLSMLISVNYSLLSRMENPGGLMAATPGLLAGRKVLPAELSGQLLQGVQQLWQRVQSERSKKGGEKSDAELLATAFPKEMTALLKFVLGNGIDLSKGYVDTNRMSQMITSLNDAELLALWIKLGGKSIAGDFGMIAELLEKDLVDDAISLAPTAGPNSNYQSRLYSFTGHLESLVAKLRAHPSPQAFRVAVRYSVLPDALRTDVPTENWNQRKARLIREIEPIRKKLTLEERIEICMLLRLDLVTRWYVPVLDDFATDRAAKEFSAMLTSGSETDIARLFVPAVCNRVHAGDLSGLARLIAIIDSVPTVRLDENRLVYSVIQPVHACLLSCIASLDGKCPPATLESILTCCKVFAICKQPEYRGMAAQLVHFVSTDAASLEAGLKRCGLEGVKPSASVDSNYTVHSNPATLKTLFRLALQHPISSDALLDSLNSESDYKVKIEALLTALRDPKLRARFSPAVFLKWNRAIVSLEAEDIETLKLYATERRAEFDETQRAELDRLLERWQKASDPKVLEQLRIRREETRAREEQQRIRRMQTE